MGDKIEVTFDINDDNLSLERTYLQPQAKRSVLGCVITDPAKLYKSRRFSAQLTFPGFVYNMAAPVIQCQLMLATDC